MATDYFGPGVAENYDARSESMFEPDVVTPAVTFLARLAGDGAALEFGVGTGRLALPLREHGVTVQGIDLSTAMLAELAAKPGGAQLEVVAGDFSNARVPGSFRLVYLVFNTIMNLTSQDGQVACFRNAAEHLEPGGRFVIEVMTPDLQRLPFGESFRPFIVSRAHLGIDEYDVATQRLVSHHYTVSDTAVDIASIPFRYVWPAELDLMARLAGMSLEARYADWSRNPFTSTSASHVSVWRRR